MNIFIEKKLSSKLVAITKLVLQKSMFNKNLHELYRRILRTNFLQYEDLKKSWM